MIHQGVSTLSEQESESAARGRKSADDFIEAATHICEREGAQAVTARRVAREMGLSPMALYRHFKGMNHLLAMVWNEGFAQLRSALDDVVEAGGHGLASFRKELGVYVRFGVSHPGLYQFMFSTGPRPEEFGEKNVGLETLHLFRQRIIELKEAGLIPPGGDPMLLCINAWFMLHGLTSLAISGQVLRVTNLELDEVIRDTTERIVRSL